MSRVGPESAEAQQIGRFRSSVYVFAVCTRTLIAMVALALLTLPIGLVLRSSSRGAEGTTALIAAGLALLGLGIPLISLALTRADWSGAAMLLRRSAGDQPYPRLSEPRTLVRPLAYTVVMLTLGGAFSVLIALLVAGACVALLSPVLTAVGDQAVIGPFVVRTMPQALLAVAVACGIFLAFIFLSPMIARVHALLTTQMLTRPEQLLQRDLTSTSLSRTRIVRAFDVERRRIERDLHDGVQPQLVSVSITLGLALAEMPAHASGRDDVLRALQQSRQALEALRQFVRNIHPQVLVDHGLGAAIRELADTLTVPTRITDRLTERLPAGVETNLYFCVAELLTNLVKHSGATRAEIHLDTPRRGYTQLSIRDDGIGGAGSPHEAGGGLAGIADRINAFDGTLSIDSPLGGPTVITITLATLDPELWDV